MAKKTQMTKAQRDAKKAAEEEKRKAAERKYARQQRFKRIGVIILVIILVLGLCIPTVAISLLGASI